MNVFRAVSLVIALLIPSLSWAQWVNEPTDFTPLTDWSFSNSSGSGWTAYNGTESITSDGTAPLSPPNVGRIAYPQGLEAGGYPGAWFYSFPSPTREVYLGFWWRASVGYQQHGSNRTKIAFISDTGGNPLFFYMGGVQGTSYYIGMQHQGPQCNGDLAGFPGICGTWDAPGGTYFPEGSWVKIEGYFKMSTTGTSQDGIFRFWVNGILQQSFTTWNSNQNLYSSVPIAPVWGGVGGVKAQTDYFYYDHMRISVPNCSQTPSSCGITPPPPPSPTPPPPPSPTPPPPPPPSSCGTSSTTAFDSVTDFCSTQGPRWYYLNSDLSQMTWSGTQWNGADAYEGVWGPGQHPGSSTPSIRRWVVPSTGTWTISGITGDYDTAGGDGVIASVTKNNATTLYSRTIPNGGGDVTYSLSSSLTSGDTLEFQVSPRANNSYDSTHFTATIQLVPAPPPPGPGPPPPPPPSVLPQNCVVQWEASGEADVSFYRVYWGTSAGVYGVPLAVPLASNPFTSCARLGISAAGTYYFSVASVDTSGNEGAKSSEVSVVFTGSTPDVTAPGAPQNVRGQ